MPAKFVNLIQPNSGFNLPLRELPTLKNQRRKQQAKSSLDPAKMCGADTETVDGKVWLFSTEFGVWEIDNEILAELQCSTPSANNPPS